MREIFEIVYLVKCENIKTQRDLADRMFVSLGKINNLMSEAIAQNFINNDQGYVVTEKGEAFLEEHKVDNAIIMAAGFGSRFVPMTYETPKGLLDVNGEVMIERQIRQLQEVGINDISIVVGYLKETFEYLTEKFGVKLIYNPDYSIKNNIQININEAINETIKKTLLDNYNSPLRKLLEVSVDKYKTDIIERLDRALMVVLCDQEFNSFLEEAVTLAIKFPSTGELLSITFPVANHFPPVEVPLFSALIPKFFKTFSIPKSLFFFDIMLNLNFGKYIKF